MKSSMTQEIKDANRKALPKFLILMVICCVVGGIIGVLLAFSDISQWNGALDAAASWFSVTLAPWLLAATAVILPLICIPLYLSTKKQLDAWDGEDEEESVRIEGKLSILMWIPGIMMIVNVFLLGASYSEGINILEGTFDARLFFLSIGGFMVALGEIIVIQQKAVDLTTIMNPEKKGSVYDMQFHEKWLESCDEAERLLIGKCALEAFKKTNFVCSLLAILLAVGALVFDIGFLPSFSVCLIWMVNQNAYLMESMKYSKAGINV